MKEEMEAVLNKFRSRTEGYLDEVLYPQPTELLSNMLVIEAEINSEVEDKRILCQNTNIKGRREDYIYRFYYIQNDLSQIEHIKLQTLRGYCKFFFKDFNILMPNEKFDYSDIEIIEFLKDSKPLVYNFNLIFDLIRNSVSELGYDSWTKMIQSKDDNIKYLSIMLGNILSIPELDQKKVIGLNDKDVFKVLSAPLCDIEKMKDDMALRVKRLKSSGWLPADMSDSDSVCERHIQILVKMIGEVFKITRKCIGLDEVLQTPVHVEGVINVNNAEIIKKEKDLYRIKDVIRYRFFCPNDTVGVERIGMILFNEVLGIKKTGSKQLTTSFIKAFSTTTFKLGCVLNDWLDQLPEWDGTPRLDTYFSYLFNHVLDEDSNDTRECNHEMKKFLITLVLRIRARKERIYIKNDVIPILIGDGGEGKTLFVNNILPSSGFVYTKSDLHDARERSTIIAESSAQIVLLEEVDLSPRNPYFESFKRMTTTEVTHCTQLYSSVVYSQPSHKVFIACTNNKNILADRRIKRIDVSRNRKYPREATQKAILIPKKLQEIREQLFAEALYFIKEKTDKGVPLSDVVFTLGKFGEESTTDMMRWITYEAEIVFQPRKVGYSAPTLRVFPSKVPKYIINAVKDVETQSNKRDWKVNAKGSVYIARKTNQEILNTLYNLLNNKHIPWKREEFLNQLIEEVKVVMRKKGEIV